MKHKILECISKKKYDIFEKMILSHKAALSSRTIVIWGAGVLGIQFSMVLKKFCDKEFFFCDNDPQKWGKTKMETKILSPQALENKSSEFFIFLAIEEALDCALQIQNMGYKNGCDWCNLDDEVQKNFVLNFTENTDAECLVFADCISENVSIEDAEDGSIGDNLNLNCSTKIVSLNGLYMRAYYNLLAVLSAKMKNLKTVMFLIDLSTFAPRVHLLKGNQHANLMKLIFGREGTLEEEQRQFLQETEKRSSTLAFEGVANIRNDSASEVQIELAKKIYTKLNYMYTWDEYSESVVYLERILQICAEQHIKLMFVLMPINYILAKRYFGAQFTEKYGAILSHLNDHLKKPCVKTIDLSFLLQEKDFISITNTSEGIRASGRTETVRAIFDAINLEEDG